MLTATRLFPQENSAANAVIALIKAIILKSFCRKTPCKNEGKCNISTKLRE